MSNKNFNAWHDVTYGEKAPQVVNVIIEITENSKAKYELDKETGLLRLDRIISADSGYPFYYGFIPQTYCDDKDPLDAVILSSQHLVPLSLVEIKVVGAIKMIDQGEQDDKIIGVIASDPEFKHIQDISDINPAKLNEIVNFFQTYKLKENKVVKIERVINKEEALKTVEDSIKLYKNTYK